MQWQVLGSYGGEDSPDDISRGLFAGEVGSLRILNLFQRFGIKATWFVPGHSIETFPDQMKKVVDAGHEIGIRGYSHENPIALTPDQEEIVLDIVSISRPNYTAGLPPATSRVVGIQPGDERPAAKEGHQIRSQPDASRLPAVLCTHRRHLDED